VQQLHVLVEFRFELLGELGAGYGLFVGAGDYFVVEVGDVHAEGDVVVEVAGEDAAEDVEA